MPTSEFQFLGVAHVVVLALTLTLPLALSVWVRKASSSVLTDAVCYLLATVLIVNEIGVWVYRIATVPSFNEFYTELPAPSHLWGCPLCRRACVVASKPDPL